MQIALECRQCGAALDITEGQKIVKCKFCGSSNVVSLADRYGLYNRANYLRRHNEFDRAIGIYEDILKENPQDSEAFFGIALSKYGVEYVDDPAGNGKIPTLHRTRHALIMHDNDMKNALLYADMETAEFYREEAEKIDAIQKKIWALTEQQEKYDIFICYKEGDGQGGRTQTSVLSQDIYNELVKNGYKVFFARKTLESKIGKDYEPIIFAALYSAKVMLLVGCKEEEFQGTWVRNEWTRFRERVINGEECSLIPIYKNMSPYDLPQEFVNLQSLDMGKIGFMQDLLDGLEKIIGKSRENVVIKEHAVNHNGNVADNLKKRAGIALEQGDFKTAKEYIERALDVAPEDAECYIKRVQVTTKCRLESELGRLPKSIAGINDYQLALRFADDKKRILYQSYEKLIQEGIRKRMEAAEAEKIALAKVNEELKKKRKEERISLLKKLPLICLLVIILVFTAKRINALVEEAKEERLEEQERERREQEWEVAEQERKAYNEISDYYDNVFDELCGTENKAFLFTSGDGVTYKLEGYYIYGDLNDDGVYDAFDGRVYQMNSGFEPVYYEENKAVEYPLSAKNDRGSLVEDAATGIISAYSKYHLDYDSYGFIQVKCVDEDEKQYYINSDLIPGLASGWYLLEEMSDEALATLRDKEQQIYREKMNFDRMKEDLKAIFTGDKFTKEIGGVKVQFSGDSYIHLIFDRNGDGQYNTGDGVMYTIGLGLKMSGMKGEYTDGIWLVTGEALLAAEGYNNAWNAHGEDVTARISWHKESNGTYTYILQSDEIPYLENGVELTR